MNLKFRIRKKILERRDQFEEHKYSEKDLVIYEKIEKLLYELMFNFKPLEIKNQVDKNFAKFDSRIALGLYYPLKTEPDMFKLSVTSNWCIALPKISNTEMDYVRYQIGNKLIKSHFGDLCEPAGNEIIIPKVALIPGLAFDVQGYRLGFGIGHYDRYFARKQHKDIVKIGVCYDEILKERLPHDSHDIKMDYIITEKNIYLINKKIGLL